MKKRRLTSMFFALLLLLGTGGIALAQQPAPPSLPPGAGDVQPGDTERGNLSGLRGLDRADQAAGEHGQQGRDIARENVIRGGDRQERLNRPERPVRPERSERPMRPERPGR